tara:strand:+ start:767 stop:1012 length:246 start_codon:yes stop_codon:yes gene_type:complete
MEVILFVVVAIYSMVLNLRLREAQEEIIDLGISIEESEIKVYNKMMEIRKDIKQSIKKTKVEKSRRRSTKRSRKVSPTKIS